MVKQSLAIAALVATANFFAVTPEQPNVFITNQTGRVVDLRVKADLIGTSKSKGGSVHVIVQPMSTATVDTTQITKKIRNETEVDPASKAKLEKKPGKKQKGIVTGTERVIDTIGALQAIKLQKFHAETRDGETIIAKGSMKLRGPLQDASSVTITEKDGKFFFEVQ